MNCVVTYPAIPEGGGGGGGGGGRGGEQVEPGNKVNSGMNN